MVNWNLTATTIYCNCINKEVTIIVYKDGTVNCTGFSPHNNQSDKGIALTTEKSVEPQNINICDTLSCSNITNYRDQLFSEEQSEIG